MYLKSVKTALVLTYLVIVAGAVVRMTGSGMGCPDWPKCFGYYIPPTDVSQLTFKPNHAYKKGHLIIVDKSLMTAASSFTSHTQYEPKNWKPYTKHDYARFNPAHTWTEYINRLMGALAGLAVFVMAVISVKKWRADKALPVLSWLAVFLMGFQGWLGATVVYSVLEPVMITVHMLMALIIIGLLIYILFRASPRRELRPENDGYRIFYNILLTTLGLTLVQTAFGAQLRQFVDGQVKLFGDDNPGQWLATPPVVFYLHRTLSILVVLTTAGLWWLNRNRQLGLGKVTWIVWLVAIEALIGVVMYYFDFPFLTQPLHLVLAALLFGLQFYLVLECRTMKKV